MNIERLSPLRTERLGNRLWVLLSAFEFAVDGKLYKIPPGFVYDGNSTPRALWALCSPVGGAYGEAGPPHDYFYSLDCQEDVSKKYADNVHRAIGVHRGANRPRARAVHEGLRLFGKSSYRKKYSIEKLTEESCYNFKHACGLVFALRNE